MEIHSEKDFLELRNHFRKWRSRFPMFKHNVKQIEDAIEKHITKYSQHLVKYRQTKNKSHIEHAQVEIDEINRILKTVEKIELMALLSKR
jgi:hypothetical protein